MDLKENLELQLSELEMLNSMFPNDDELLVTDPGVISDIQDFLSGKLDKSDLSELEYTINLNIQGVKVAIKVALPNLYPSEQAHISIHSGSLSRSNHDKVDVDFKDFQKSFDTGTLCIGLAVEWVQENLLKYTKNLAPDEVQEKKVDSSQCRMWIQSHHIYSKSKIASIQDWAKELDLAGFILPGKPGFVCIEGSNSNSQIWWQRVRGMNWQRISCKLEEHDQEKRFQGFVNIAAIKGGDESNMKAFLNYLEEHRSSHVFKEYFGFDGK